MAAKETETKAADDGRVEVYVPRDYSDQEQNLIVGINGKTYNLPRGKTSRVPTEVAEEIARSRRAQDRLFETIEAEQAKAGAPVALADG